MSDTPRTEAAIASQLQHYSITSMVLADFARTLEREGAAARARAEQAEARLAECLKYIEHRRSKFSPQRPLTTCEHGEQNWLDQLVRDTSPPILEEVERLRSALENSKDQTELMISSRGKWMSKCEAAKQELDALRARLEVAKGLLGAAVCPNCDGSGATIRGEHRTVSREMAMDAGDPGLEGAPLSEPEIEQCQWCDERTKTLAKLNAEEKK